ncbi:CPCC family cysteine-rich protein [Nocardioides sp. LML1-1-1.1]|uniref:CPCC family cysteine-rich protein n=1 Tax=Nocardioides sp. LML1-1-1.1 TaxID=3135248 RepID=UPI0034380CBE
MARLPCPCCGHLTLDEGPGDFEICEVCFWEDDGVQLRYPMSPEGPNGVSLMEAQQAYTRSGAMHPGFRRKVRTPHHDEPLDAGWRPFDPALDWTNPALDGDQWPVNAEALYYWRDTYWNGDQHRLPAAPAEPTNEDRFLDHLRQVPELEAAIAESGRRWGAAHAFDVCRSAAEVALRAYRDGDDATGRRIVGAMVPALDEGSPAYAPNCVAIAFLEDHAWHEPWVQPYVDRWPAPVRDELRERQAHLQRHTEEQAQRHDAFEELFRSGRGRPVDAVAAELRALQSHAYDDPRTNWSRQVLARFISDPRWIYRHPVDSLALAWRYRAVASPLRTLAQLNRPRVSG